MIQNCFFVLLNHKSFCFIQQRKSRVAPAPDDEGDDTEKETLQEAHSHTADELVEVVTVNAHSEEDKEDLTKTEDKDSSSNTSESLQAPEVWFGWVNL